VYSALFGQVGDLVEQAFQALLEGDMRQVGMFMDRNHSLLQELGVSIDELDQLVDCARAAGALGAKLSGAGAGGFMLALVTPSTSDQVAEALRAAGASHTISTQV
jgi:mevalonate kinase